MNIHLVPRTLYFSRHGESINNVVGKIGGDSELSNRGEKYVTALADLINEKNIQGE
jgi:6-phosphofructo-2-kinase/fructose-2,6-biphosphatase 2